MTNEIKSVCNYYYPGMTPERYKYLNSNKATGKAELTPEENKTWHFCASWDWLLIHKDDVEISGCQCGWKPAEEI